MCVEIGFSQTVSLTNEELQMTNLDTKSEVRMLPEKHELQA